MAPAFLAAQPNLQAYVRHVRETKHRTERRDMVRAHFASLFDCLGDAEAIGSSAWTGKLSRREQAEIVQAISPAALTVVQRLIDNEMRLRGNGGPVDDGREQALRHLHDLHDALGELIRLSEAEQPLDAALGALQTIRRRPEPPSGGRPPLCASRHLRCRASLASLNSPSYSSTILSRRSPLAPSPAIR